ncbi:uncharacterized protein LOC111021066 isoform X1 [Momordica charantia]|uniref:Uncharacterized protein LOC111021066 isoform X1 n=1 Tax=Momordica charantia TaxID=3673 RepID=A0A6J1DHW8_MOMCH|nr:uncharacterized protein LOC111021066 isoform X1 [Momordica charantia]XP_022153598.1 uncharacterized protein LOC111021066 isoform X1 [Momordica charantia]
MEGNNRGDFLGNVVKQSSLRSSGSFKSALSGKSTPRGSPSFRRLHSSRTPRREARSSGYGLHWIRSNKVLFWLLLITLWAYLGFYVQSRWAHGENKEDFLGFGSQQSNQKLDSEQNQSQNLVATNHLVVENRPGENNGSDGGMVNVVLARKGNGVSASKKTKSRKRNKKSKRGKVRGRGKMTAEVTSHDIEEQEPEIPLKNSSYGLLVGPFGSTEDRILEWSPEKRSGTCDRKGDFARLVWSRRFVLIFHELSMTGAPISMMELATELLSCGASVSAVALSKKGGLMSELSRRRIKVLDDKADLSFKTAMKSDLVIAGSAVCASWIDSYIEHFPAGASQVAWWIMENRREYFNRSKVVLDRVKMLIFISELQSKQWLNWCQDENIKLRSQPAIVPLSVNDELAFTAGIPCSLNTESSSSEKMAERKQLLRSTVRKEMGVADSDVVVMTLSSINPGKGHFLLLESTNLLIDPGSKQDNSKIMNPDDTSPVRSNLVRRRYMRALLQKLSDNGLSLKELPIFNETFNRLNVSRKNSIQNLYPHSPVNEMASATGRRLLVDSVGRQEMPFKLVIGSVGSKSNKVIYVKRLLRFLAQHSNLSKSVLWTPATTRVASLYSAADIYVINSQGLGETFGRVTIEAMAFGLPVLGTDAGGTKEIVEHNVTGLLHPLGHPGTQVLAQNLQFLLKNPQVREQMGAEGRKKVKKMYLKRHMYKKFVEVIVKCMRTK